MNATRTYLAALVLALGLAGPTALAQEAASDDQANEQPAPYEVRLVTSPVPSTAEIGGAVPPSAERAAPVSLGHAEGEATPALPPYEVLTISLPDILLAEVGGAVPPSAERAAAVSLGHAEGEATPALPPYEVRLVTLPPAPESETSDGAAPSRRAPPDTARAADDASRAMPPVRRTRDQR